MIMFLTEVSTDFNPDDVTPGVIGFVATAVFAVAILFLGRDLYKRIRRVRYREQIREEIAQEVADNNPEQ